METPKSQEPRAKSPFVLTELAEKIGAVVSRGDRQRTISGVASLQDAGAEQLAFFSDPKYQQQAVTSRAGAIVTRQDAADAAGSLWPESAALLIAADPEMAFVKAIALFHPPVAETPGIDARAVIEPDVEIGAGATIAAYAVIRGGARIGARTVVLPHAVIGRDCRLGDDCQIHPHVILYDGTIIGNRVTVHSGTVLGADGFGYKFRGGRHIKVPQVGHVEIGDDVEIGANTCIDRGALSPTRIGNGTKIDNLVQIGHGSIVGNHCILCGQSAMAGSCTMEDYSVLGGNAGLADHVVMGKGSKAAAKAGIGKDVRPGAEVFGLFADERKVAFRQLAAYRRLPEILERLRALERELAELKHDEPIDPPSPFGIGPT